MVQIAVALLLHFCHAWVFQPQEKARAERGRRAGAELHLLLQLLLKRRGVSGSQPLSCPLCSAQAAAAAKAASLCSAAAKGVAAASLVVWLPLVTANCLLPTSRLSQRHTEGEAAPKFPKSQYSSLTTSLSSLASFLGVYCLSLCVK